MPNDLSDRSGLPANGDSGDRSERPAGGDSGDRSELPASGDSEGRGGSPRIVFMGTPEFAVASLEAILQAGYHVVGVVTAPDKPAGRGMQLTESAVKKYAVSQGLHVLQPEKLRDASFLSALGALHADLQIVVAFRMLPEIVWNRPPMGTVNLHGSLLPQYRGAAPINWAVINGETVTGVTTFKLQHEIDTGSILLQESFPILDTDTAGDVHDRMMKIGAQLLVKTIAGLVAGTLSPVPQQNPPDLRHAPKIFTETCRIDWTKSTVSIYNLIRGLSPFPAAFTELDGKVLKIFRSENEIRSPDSTAAGSSAAGAATSGNTSTGAAASGSVAAGGATSGAAASGAAASGSAGAAASDGGGDLDTDSAARYDTDGKTWLRFSTADGWIRVTELQLEGKKKMGVGEFLRGYRPRNQTSR